MILRLKEIRSVLEAAQTQSVSMRRRLMLYLFTIMLFFAFLIAMLLFLFGAIDPIGYEIERALSNQLENSVNSIEHQSNDQAAYVLAFSQQITAAVKDELSDAGITFNELRNTPDALESMQNRLFDIVSSNMKLAPCSGAFCFLKTTVNDALPDKSYPPKARHGYARPPCPHTRFLPWPPGPHGPERHAGTTDRMRA